MHYQPKGYNQKLYLEHFRSKKVTIGMGPAGTGKTLLAMDFAIHSSASRIILTRPMVEACQEEIGFLPGNAEYKIAPYIRVFEEYVNQLGGAALLNKHKVLDKLPLAHMRGLTFANAIIILDEAQNCTFEQLKMILTRLGENATLIITGDPDQADIRNSGLLEVVKRIESMPEVGIVRFTDKDSLRSGFVKAVLERLGKEWVAK